jgi:hypothetical protein
VNSLPSLDKQEMAGCFWFVWPISRHTALLPAAVGGEGNCKSTCGFRHISESNGGPGSIFTKQQRSKERSVAPQKGHLTQYQERISVLSRKMIKKMTWTEYKEI